MPSVTTIVLKTFPTNLAQKGTFVTVGRNMFFKIGFGLELLPTELTGNNFSHMRFYVVPHVLSDLTKLATDKALQLTTFRLSREAFNLVIQSCCVSLRIL